VLLVILNLLHLKLNEFFIVGLYNLGFGYFDASIVRNLGLINNEIHPDPTQVDRLKTII
jgi:hypothetical protein